MVTIDRQWIILYNDLLLYTPQPEDVVEYNCKEIFDLLVFFMAALIGCTVPQHTDISDCFELWFRGAKPADRSLRFDCRCV